MIVGERLCGRPAQAELDARRGDGGGAGEEEGAGLVTQLWA
jgi:hypothetical protein